MERKSARRPVFKVLGRTWGCGGWRVAGGRGFCKRMFGFSGGVVLGVVCG
jgi:hypothetical protein